jgi:hypothetical protein
MVIVIACGARVRLLKVEWRPIVLFKSSKVFSSIDCASDRVSNGTGMLGYVLAWYVNSLSLMYIHEPDNSLCYRFLLKSKVAVVEGDDQR